MLACLWRNGVKSTGICVAAGKAGWETGLPWRLFNQDYSFRYSEDRNGKAFAAVLLDQWEGGFIPRISCYPA